MHRKLDKWSDIIALFTRQIRSRNMILKIIGGIFGYLLCGVGVLELIRLHDRHTDYIDQWLEYDDESEQVIVVVLFPYFLVCLFIPWLIGKFVFAFIRVVQMIFTTLTCIVVALIKGKDKEQEDGNDD